MLSCVRAATVGREWKRREKAKGEEGEERMRERRKNYERKTEREKERKNTRKWVRERAIRLEQ